MSPLPLALIDPMVLQIPLSPPLCQKTSALRPALAIAGLLIPFR
jgi:hypothetical protein